MRSLLTIAIFIAAISAWAAEAPQHFPDKSSLVEVPSPPRLPISWPILRDSAKIFSSTVLRVEHRNSDSSSALATTRIVFRVDEGIRNVRRGQVVEVKEWAGLWQSGEHYHRGERVLLFLYPASKLGLTSPVGSRSGRFRVDRAGRVIVKGPVGKAAQRIEIRRIVAGIRQAERK